MPVLRWKGVEDTEVAAKIVGPRLRALRQNRGLTIRELAERAEVSKNTLLRIEKGFPISEPQLDRICNRLQTIVPQLLLPEPTEAEKMVRVHRDDPAAWRIAFRRKRAPKTVQDFDPVPEPAERIRLGTVGFVSGFVQAHTSLPAGRLQSAVVEVFGLQESPGFRHSGEEFVYCLSGVLQLVVGDEKRVLYPGDTAVFDSKFRHRYESAPENPEPSAKLLMVWYEAQEEGFSIQRDAECEAEYAER